jgi:hypothetical protein
MTLDEAANILNVKKPSEAFKEGSSELQQMLKVSRFSFQKFVEMEYVLTEKGSGYHRTLIIYSTQTIH